MWIYNVKILGVITNTVMTFSFLLLSIGLLRMFSMSRDEGILRLSLGFTLLSTSGVLGVIMFLTDSLRVATSLYTATSTFALSGLLMTFLAQKTNFKRIYVIHPILLTAFLLDVATGVIGVIASLKFRSWARTGLLAFSISFMFRGVSVLWLSSGGSALPLAVVEVIRSLSSAIIAFYYVVEVFISSAKEV